MFIAVGNSINGGAGTGTGSGGGGSNRTAPVFQLLVSPTDRVPKFYQLSFTSQSVFPFSVFIGETEYVINSTADIVSGQTSQLGVPVEASVSFGAKFQLGFGRGGSANINKIFRFDNLIVGRDAFDDVEDRDYSGVTTLPARILDDLSFCFSSATGLPSNIGLWDVSNVVDFLGMFNGVPESAMSDANVALCLEGWDSVGQGTSVDATDMFGTVVSGGGPRTLSESTYPNAKTAYDNLIANNSWDFTGSFNWIA